MKPLSKAGWFSMGIAIVLFLAAFSHYDGWTNPTVAVLQLIGTAFWGGIFLASLFIALMAALFLSA